MTVGTATGAGADTNAAPAGGAGRRRRRPRHLGGLAVLARPLALYVGARAAALVAFAVAARLNPGEGLLGVLGAWDGAIYVRLAEAGYPRTVVSGQDYEVAMFPLFPLAIDAVTAATPLGPLAAAIAVNGLFGAAFAVLLWLIVRRISGAEVADRATALVLFFPGALSLGMAYAEALMLTLVTGSLLALLHRRWALAGALAALATASRPNAIAVCAACAWAAAVAVHHRREWRALLAPTLSPLGFVAFQLWLWQHTGDAGVWFRAQREGWAEHFDFGLTTLRRLQETAADPLANPNVAVAAAGTVLIVVLLPLLWRWRPPGALVAYTAVVVVLALGAQTLGARPRFVMTAFPLLAALAPVFRGAAFTAVVGVFAAAGAALSIVVATTLLVTP